MFVYYFVPVAGRPFPEVEEALLDAMEDLPWVAEAASRAGVALEGRAEGPERLRVTAGAPTRGLHETAIPLTWEAPPGAPFRRLDADVVLADLGPNLMHLAFRGTVPRSALRRTQDPRQGRAQRATELIVKGFLDHLAAEIDARLPLRSSA